MQRLFRDGRLSENAALGYGERVRQFHETVNSKNEGIDVLAEFVEGNVLALHNLEDSIRSEEHTSELQSLMRISYAVVCLKKHINNTIINNVFINLIHSMYILLVYRIL